MSDDVTITFVKNERTKLLANALNTACTSCVTVGIATPAAGYLYNVSGFRTSVSLEGLTLGFAVWLLSAAGLHLLARRSLGGLKP